jgi:plasmid stabilization system protein ParE
MSERFMKSIYKIIWSDQALRNLKSIIDYLENRWTEKEIGKFSKLLDHNLKLIEAMPFLSPLSFDFQNTRKAILSHQTTIYY